MWPLQRAQTFTETNLQLPFTWVYIRTLHEKLVHEDFSGCSRQTLPLWPSPFSSRAPKRVSLWVPLRSQNNSVFHSLIAVRIHIPSWPSPKPVTHLNSVSPQETFGPYKSKVTHQVTANMTAGTQSMSLLSPVPQFSVLPISGPAPMELIIYIIITYIHRYKCHIYIHTYHIIYMQI